MTPGKDRVEEASWIENCTENDPWGAGPVYTRINPRAQMEILVNSSTEARRTSQLEQLNPWG